MLVVKVILHNAVTGEVSDIGQMTIAQVEQYEGTPLRDYHVQALWHAPDFALRPGKHSRAGIVYGHNRNSDLFSLVHKAIEALYERG